MDAAECVACGCPFKPEAAFCSACGHRRGDPPVDRAALVQARMHKLRRVEAGWSGIRSVILLYLVLLGGIGLGHFIRMASDEFTGELACSAIIGGIIVVAALLHRDELKTCIRSAGFSWRGYSALVVASIPIVLAVHGYVAGLHRLFRLHPDPELSAYLGRGPAWAFLLYAVSPAIFEEIGFRGVIFGLLCRSLDARETILLSGAAFGILHLSVPSLLTHVPLGLYLGWLRHRSGSLYPSMAAHFLHNALVVAGTTWSLFPGS
jgi:membrane protease YdiL (CAAX protease family)